MKKKTILLNSLVRIMKSRPPMDKRDSEASLRDDAAAGEAAGRIDFKAYGVGVEKLRVVLRRATDTKPIGFDLHPGCALLKVTVQLTSEPPIRLG